jgi:hypothetical protein
MRRYLCSVAHWRVPSIFVFIHCSANIYYTFIWWDFASSCDHRCDTHGVLLAYYYYFKVIITIIIIILWLWNTKATLTETMVKWETFLLKSLMWYFSVGSTNYRLRFGQFCWHTISTMSESENFRSTTQHKTSNQSLR